MNRLTSLPCLVATLIVALGSNTAFAQATNDAAAAQTLFDEAKALFDSGKFKEACPKFAESHALDPGVGVLLYLGDCYEKTSRLASAWAAYKEAIPAAQARGQTEREQIATDRAKAIEPRLPKLRISVTPGNRVAGLVVSKDGASVREPTWGTALPVDAGPHVIEATAPGRKLWKTTVTASEGTLATIEIPALVEDRAAPSPIGQTRPAVEFWGAQRIASVVVAGVGLGGVVVGTVFGVRTIEDWDSTKDHCDDGEPPACDDEGVQLANDVEVEGIVSTVGVTVGVAALGTALVLWFTAPRAAAASDARLHPIFRRGAELGLHGSRGELLMTTRHSLVGVALAIGCAGCHLLVGWEEVVPAEGGAATGGGGSGAGASGGGPVGGQGGDGGTTAEGCENDQMDGSETDVDCGGDCTPCAPGDSCLTNTDCDSLVCDDDVCQEPSCFDNVANGDETDLDCGGTCQANCGLGRHCMSSTDCSGAASCERTVCVPEPIGYWYDTGNVVPSADGYYERFAMAFDESASQTLLFGGQFGASASDKTFSYSPTGWVYEDAGPPLARFWHAMTYDTVRGVSVLYGGGGPGGNDPATWERAPMGEWVEAVASSPPDVRVKHAMAFDSVRAKSVLFGGEAGGTALNDTWDYDGAWALRTDVVDKPGARINHVMVYDSVRQVTLMFGGYTQGQASQIDETWQWDGGASWTLVSNTGPSARGDTAMAFDSWRGRAVLFGGHAGTQVVGDTWEWDGVEWHPMTTINAPPADEKHAMVFDEARGRVVYLRETSPFLAVWEYYALATPCASDGDCGSDHCEDNLCCDRACLAGESCNLDASPGQCSTP